MIVYAVEGVEVGYGLPGLHRLVGSPLLKGTGIVEEGKQLFEGFQQNTIFGLVEDHASHALPVQGQDPP